jgi:hypothetical protein
MKASVLFFVLALAAISCKDKDEPAICGVDDPVNELEWLKAKIAELDNSELSRKYFYVVQADYNGQVIFYVNNCCPMCSTVILYYDCAGNELKSVDTSQVRNGKRIWASAQLECVFYD